MTKKDFPIFANQGLSAYLDTAASAQKPKVVLDAIQDFYSNSYANIHRGAYQLSAQATVDYEKVRQSTAKFLGLTNAAGVLFTRGATEGINCIAYTLEDRFVDGDTILLTTLEHHSNIVPWQMLAERKAQQGITLNIEFVDLKSDTTVDLEDYKAKLLKKPKLVAMTMQSNAFGTLLPLQEMLSLAQDAGSLVLFDACQYVVHFPIDLSQLSVDFLVFSAHKLYGPTGLGILYVRPDLLATLPPFHGGGDMVLEVSTEGFTPAKIPQKFEAGTPPVAEVIAFAQAIQYVKQQGYDNIARHDQELLTFAIEELQKLDDLTLYGPLDYQQQASILSFNLKIVHPHDFASIADSFGVQLRAGFHCAMPALKAFGLNATIRMSLGIYNEKDDILKLTEAIKQARKILR